MTSLQELILVRLLAAGEKGELGSKVRKDLEPVLSHRWAGAALAERIERALDELESAGQVASLPGKTKRAAPGSSRPPRGAGGRSRRWASPS